MQGSTHLPPVQVFTGKAAKVRLYFLEIRPQREVSFGKKECVRKRLVVRRALSRRRKMSMGILPF